MKDVVFKDVVKRLSCLSCSCLISDMNCSDSDDKISKRLVSNNPQGTHKRRSRGRDFLWMMIKRPKVANMKSVQPISDIWAYVLFLPSMGAKSPSLH